MRSGTIPACDNESSKRVCLSLANQALLRVSDRLRAPAIQANPNRIQIANTVRGSSELNPARDNVVGHQHKMFDNYNPERERSGSDIESAVAPGDNVLWYK